MRRHWVRISVTLGIMVVFAAYGAGWIRWSFIDGLERDAYDYRVNLTMPRTVDHRIAIIDIDEKSLRAEGRWPWSRDKMAALVNRLFGEYHPAVLGFDIVFAEPDHSSGLPVLENLAETKLRNDAQFASSLQELRPELNYDRQFAQSLKGRPIILGYFFSDIGETGEAPHTGELPPPTFGVGAFAGHAIDFIRARGYGANLAEFQNNALGAGHFNPYVDSDGKVRRVPMLYEYRGKYYDALSLAVAKAYLHVKRIIPGFPEQSQADSGYSGIEWLQLGSHRIPVDNRVRALVPYRGPQGSFPYYSATDVLHGRVPVEDLAGKIVLVGTTAAGLQDLRSTPVQPAFPGVEIHADLIAGILDDSILQEPAYTRGAEFIALIVAGLMVALVLPPLSPLWAAVATLVLLAGIVGTNLAIWEYGHLVFPIASGLLMVLVMFLFNMSWGYFVESRGKRQLANLFGQYVPPELVDEMNENPGSFTVEGESREMTVLFSDVRSFTTISEGLQPKDLSRLMSEFLTPMTRTIHEHRGTIDKYMGDAIMAFWGAPIRDSEHARHALEAGLEMLTVMRSMQGHFRARGWPEIRIGVGVNTGAMSVGNMGSEFRMAYTVLGDAVNLGSRLEGLTKGYGVDIICSEFTRDAVPDFAYRELDRVRVKGKDKPVTIYEPLGTDGILDASTRDELALHEEALRHYRAQDWELAELHFLRLQKLAPQRTLYALYLERVTHYRDDPPGEGWDGVFTHLTK